MTDAETWGQEARELERRLLDAAEALLAHRGAGFALVRFPAGCRPAASPSATWRGCARC